MYIPRSIDRGIYVKKYLVGLCFMYNMVFEFVGCICTTLKIENSMVNLLVKIQYASNW